LQTATIVGDIDRRPPELHASSCRRDIAVGGVEHAITGAGESPLGRRGWPVGEELLDLKAEGRRARRVEPMSSAEEPSGGACEILPA